MMMTTRSLTVVLVYRNRAYFADGGFENGRLWLQHDSNMVTRQFATIAAAIEGAMELGYTHITLSGVRYDWTID